MQGGAIANDPVDGVAVGKGLTVLDLAWAGEGSTLRGSEGFSGFLQIQHLTPILPATVSASAKPYSMVERRV